MNTVVSDYIYHGLGFPVELHHVEMISWDGELHPKIDVKKVADRAIKALVLQKERLTGNQIKFIRVYFSMSLRAFAKVVNESHMAIKKWEDFGKLPTNMDRNIEIILRLYVYDQVMIKTKNNKKGKIEFYNQFVLLKEMFSQQHGTL